MKDGEVSFLRLWPSYGLPGAKVEGKKLLLLGLIRALLGASLHMLVPMSDICPSIFLLEAGEKG